MHQDRLFKFFFWAALAAPLASAQSISSGTVTGTVTDPTGAAVSNAKLELRNAVTDYRQSQVTDSSGTFRFNNVPPNPYRLIVDASGFAPTQRDVEVRS